MATEKKTKRNELKKVILTNLEKEGIKISKKPLKIILDTIEKGE